MHPPLVYYSMYRFALKGAAFNLNVHVCSADKRRSIQLYTVLLQQAGLHNPLIYFSSPSLSLAKANMKAEFQFLP